MAGSRLPEAKQQYLSDIGVPLAGAKVYTYSAGTLTPKTTYQDAALSIANTNPVIANSRGEVVMFGSGVYRLILQDSSGVTIWDQDNVQTTDIYSNPVYTSLSSSSGAGMVGYQAGTVASALDTALASVYGARERLTAARNYYIRTDGLDSNNGLSNTAGGAFLTLQRAVDVISNKVDLNGNNVTVYVGDGTYTAGMAVMAPWTGKGIVYFIGNTANPAACIVNATTLGCFYAENNANFYVGGFKVSNTGGDGVYAQTGAIINVGEMEFGPCTASQVTVGGGGFILLGKNYKISGGGSSHLHAGSPGTILGGVITVTIVGTPAYSAYFAGAAEGTITVKDVTFSGATTGPTHLAHKNGVIDTHPAFASLPGSIPGRQATGGSLIGSQTTPFQIAPNQASNNSVRLQSYNISTATYTDRFIVNSQTTGDGGDKAFLFVNGDNSYLSGITHFGATAPVALATGNDGMTTQPGMSMFVSQTSLAAANWRRNGTTGALHNFYYGAAGAALVGSITVTASATAYNTSSDYRLKDYIGPISGAWDRIKAVKTADFKFKAEPNTVVHGFLAHELAETHPLSVTGEKDATIWSDDTRKMQPVYQAIDPSKMIGDLTAALQEAMARIESLEKLNFKAKRSNKND